MWQPVIDQLEGRFDCVALDLPAHGDLINETFEPASASSTCWRTLDHLGIEETAIVGLSLGGYVAQIMTASEPTRVTGLVLSGATIRYTGWDGWSTRLYGYLFPVAARPAMRAFARKMREDLGAELADQIMAGGLSAKGGGQALRRLPGTDHAAALATYRGPVILANGERDTDNREHEEHFRKQMPRAVSVVIEDAGHACALQQPEPFARAVERMMSLAT